MNRYQRVQQILDDSIGGAGTSIGVHGPFWRGLTRDQFVVKKVVGRQLLVVNDGNSSNLVKALRGEAPFGADLPSPPPGAQLSRMPAGMDPVPPHDIDFIAKWIDEGCLEDEFLLPAGGSPALSWRATNAPIASSRTDDIWFLDPQTGWAVNSNGQIVHTTDGGESWTEQFADEDVYFRCIGFASPTRGWTGTLTVGKTLFETRDGGGTWSAVANLPALAPPAICGLSVVSEDVVYASGTNFPNRPPRMMKTLDGGATWTAWDMRPWADILIDCFFTSPTRGWVVGGKTTAPTPTRANVKPVVLFTEDGGATWANRVAGLTFPAGEWGWKIQFLDDRVGFVSLENFTAGAILKTLDGGATWVRLPVNDPQQNANLEGIGFIDEQHGWVGGWGDAGFERLSTSETLDGGATWRDANEVGKALNRFRLFGTPVTVGYASGDTVYKYAAHPEVAPAAAAVAPAAARRVRFLNALQPLTTTEDPRIEVHVPSGATSLTMRIWDRFGEPVRTLRSGSPAPGVQAVVWDRKDDCGTAASSGIYIVRVTIDGVSESRLIRSH